ncbi:hypothetical protein AGLY_014197 [Aphis glycines]|uniref:Uncharacterized protein n=1 Tax=Aphis glycines TaxID=307491 RepID=A0A6G0T4K9_APHGL|nr:hypothetical protein AGLY_014197 [Aphis glycines]
MKNDSQLRVHRPPALSTPVVCHRSPNRDSFTSVVHVSNPNSTQVSTEAYGVKLIELRLPMSYCANSGTYSIVLQGCIYHFASTCRIANIYPINNTLFCSNFRFDYWVPNCLFIESKILEFYRRRQVSIVPISEVLCPKIFNEPSVLFAMPVWSLQNVLSFGIFKLGSMNNLSGSLNLDVKCSIE